MTAYRVSVMNQAATEGTGESVEEATDVEQAKYLHAVQLGTTVDRLEAAGLTEWSVTPA